MEADQRRVATSANGAERLPYDPPQASSSLYEGAEVAVGCCGGRSCRCWSGVAVGVPLLKKDDWGYGAVFTYPVYSVNGIARPDVQRNSVTESPKR
jgi:hypothetical protein